MQFTNAQGLNRFVRYQFLPEAGEHTLAAGAEGAKSADYLSEDVAARVDANPVPFTWYAQIAEDSDVIDDPAVAWPDDRQRVPPGIGIADPMLTIRNASYPSSFQERSN